MKFYASVANPAYQMTKENTSDQPVYNLFLDATYQIADHVLMIHPARFLFNAGKTPKEWNAKMLQDEHLKILDYEPDSRKVFPSADIKGGVCISYRNSQKSFGAIGVFTAFPEMNSIYRKVKEKCEHFIDEIIYQPNRFNLKKLYEDHPEYKSIISSDGKEKRLTSGCFANLDCFSVTKPEDNDSIAIYGVLKNKREYRWLSSKYLEDNHPNFLQYKVLVPGNNGSGAIGEVLSTPLIGTPLIGYTQTFLGIGAFDTEQEATACLKYIKTKFARTTLGILKVTQNGKKEVWKCVPLQDFTSASDIDWSQSIPEIDQQLYRKYGLDEREIAFIESHVKEMA